MLLLTYLLLVLIGCYSKELTTKESVLSDETKPGLIVKTKQQINYSFERDSYEFINDTLVGKGSRLLENGAKVELDFIRRISLTDINEIESDRINLVKTTIYLVASVALGILVALIIKEINKNISSEISKKLGEQPQGIF